MKNADSEHLASDTAAPSWHSLPLPDVLAETGSSDRGLSSAEAENRLRQYGPNRLAAAKAARRLRSLPAAIP